MKLRHEDKKVARRLVKFLKVLLDNKLVIQAVDDARTVDAFDLMCDTFGSIRVYLNKGLCTTVVLHEGGMSDLLQELNNHYVNTEAGGMAHRPLFPVRCPEGGDPADTYSLHQDEGWPMWGTNSYSNARWNYIQDIVTLTEELLEETEEDC